MKKICVLLSIMVILGVLVSCENTPKDETVPHPLDYHEIMSLKTIPPGAVDFVYSDITQYFEYCVEEESPFACAEVECLDVTYYLKWDEKDQALFGFSQNKIKITRIGTAYQFPYRRGEIITVKSRISITPDVGDDADYIQRRKEFVKTVLGGIEDPETGKIILASGNYEFIPTSDMSLHLFIPEEANIPMGVGERYTTAIMYDETMEMWYCTHSYPASEDSIIFTNNFYNMTLYSQENMYIVAYLAKKKVDFEALLSDEAQ
ncbi:MAG: hypothetical protein IJW99_12325 [Clostridia bacterium]|nr:hypothetical protein [Clostridia bacterium]